MRIFKPHLIVLLLLLIVATPVFAATYEFIFPTSVSDSSGTGRTYLPVMLGYSGDSLVNSGKINANGLDTSMQISGSELNYMMASGEVVAVAPTVPASGKVTMDLYTGYAPAQTTFPIVVGDNGYITTPDNASIEMSDNATLTLTNVLLQGSDNVTYKDGAIGITYDETTENVTASVADADAARLIATLSIYNVGITVIDLTSLTILAGDVLIVNATAYNPDDISYTAGWTELYETDSVVTLSSAYKVAAGGEASVTVTTVGNPYLVCTVAQIRGSDGGVESGTSATGSSANPDPPAVTPSWDNPNTLWIVVEGHQDATKTVSSYPANYTDGIAQGGGGASGDYTSMAFRIYRAASENPGTYTLSGADDWVSNTIAVQGGSLSVTATGIASGEHDVEAGLPGWATGSVLCRAAVADVNASLNCGALYNSATNFSVGFWFKPTSAGASQYMLGKYKDGTHYLFITVDSGDYSLRFYQINGAGSTLNLQTSNYATLNAWNYAYFSLSSTGGKRLVLNGNEAGAASSANTTALPSGGNLMISELYSGHNSGIPGCYANVATWTSALTPAQEAALYYNNIPSGADNLWYCDEGTGTSITSYGSSADTATRGVNMAWTTQTYTSGMTGRPYDIYLHVDSGSVGENSYGVSVPDNANNYIFMSNATSYAGSISIEVDGVQQLLYEPDTMVGGDYYAGTADSGATTWLIDTELTQANDYWNYARLTITDTTDDAAPKGEVAVVSDFVAASDNLSFSALTAAIDVGDTYRVSFGTLEDRAGANDGTITWGYNSNLSLVYGTMSGSGSSAASANETGGFTVSSVGIPSTWFAGGENVANLPFYDMVLSVSNDTGQPVQAIYFIWILAFAFGVMILLTMQTRVALLGVLGFNIVLFIGSSMTIIPMWLPFTILIVQIGILYLYKQVAY